MGHGIPPASASLAGSTAGAIQPENAQRVRVGTSRKLATQTYTASALRSIGVDPPAQTARRNLNAICFGVSPLKQERIRAQRRGEIVSRPQRSFAKDSDFSNHRIRKLRRIGSMESRLGPIAVRTLRPGLLTLPLVLMPSAVTAVSARAGSEIWERIRSTSPFAVR